MKKNLFLCRSYYHIFISILMSIDKKIDSTLFCVEDQMDKESLHKLKNNIKSIFNNIHIEIITQNKKEYDNYLEKEYDKVYFFHWSVYKRAEYKFYRRYKNKSIYLIEDGVTHFGVYQNDIKTKKIYIKYLVNFMLIQKKEFALLDCVKAIYVTLPEKYPNYLKKKIKRLNIDFSLNDKNKQKILKLFDIDIPIDEIKDRRLAIVFTQPLSEDGFISEKEKICIYKEQIIKLKKEGYNILFKQHPREKTKYLLDESIIQLDKFFPAEILNYLNLKIEKSIAVCSGIIYNIKSDRRIQLEPDFFNKYTRS